METEKRIIIGQTEIAGMPISAPITKDPIYLSNGLYICWKKRGDGTFALVIEELSRDFSCPESTSQEVPFVEP
jgi:hypothetical protein